MNNFFPSTFTSDSLQKLMFSIIQHYIISFDGSRQTLTTTFTPLVPHRYGRDCINHYTRKYSEAPNGKNRFYRAKELLCSVKVLAVHYHRKPMCSISAIFFIRILCPVSFLLGKPFKCEGMHRPLFEPTNIM